MWALESLAKIPFKRPSFILIGTLGAAFLLLAFYFQVNPLFHPATYIIMTASLAVAFRKDLHISRVLALAAAAFVLTFLFRYQLLFCVALALLIGKTVFPETFRVWKWLASSMLLFLSIRIVSVWQQMDVLEQIVPWQILPLIHGSLFAFCAQCSVLPYPIRKDSVTEALDHYSWTPNSEAASLARQTRDLYEKVKQHLQEKDVEKKAGAELEEYTEKIIHLCYRLTEISQELAGTNAVAQEQEIAHLKQKIQTVTDTVARMQYEQALANKQRQKEQQEALRMQEERLHAQILNYVSALENMRFAYANRNFNSANSGNDSIEFFLDIARVRAEEAQQASMPM